MPWLRCILPLAQYSRTLWKWAPLGHETFCLLSTCDDCDEKYSMFFHGFSVPALNSELSGTKALQNARKALLSSVALSPLVLLNLKFHFSSLALVITSRCKIHFSIYPMLCSSPLPFSRKQTNSKTNQIKPHKN